MEDERTDRGGDAREDDAGGRAQQLDELIVRYVERLVAGETVDAEEVAREHPDLAEELLEHLKNYMEVLGEPSGESPLGTFGDYTLRREIGRGGMGVVYDAWQNSMDRRVALKVLPATISADPRACARFIREAQAAGRLNHPGVVQVHGLGIERKTPYYAMEFVDGETLARILVRLKEAGPEAETPFGRRDDLRCYVNIAEAFVAVADGLQHAHSRGVVHRDIKPSNLIFDRGGAKSPPALAAERERAAGEEAATGAEAMGAGRLRILDFGLARIEGQESLTGSGDFLGTPLYMSPEQAQARKVPIDHRTDIYSVGATLYELLTWRPPFRGRDHRDTLSQIIERDPIAPRRLNPRIPRDLETVVLKCLRKDPGERYGTAEALGQDLRRFVRGDPIEARPPGRWEVLSRRARRHRGKIFAAAAVCVAFLVLGGFSLWWAAGRRDALRLAYDAEVTDVARELYQGQFTLLGRHGGHLYDHYQHKASKFKRGPAAVKDMLEKLSRLAGAVSERPEAPYYLALLYRLLGMEEPARAEAEKALERDPTFVLAEAQVVELRNGAYVLRDGEIKELLARHAPRGDDDWQADWLQAYRSERDRDWSGAAEAYGRLIERRAKKNDPYVGYAIQALMGRGVACLEMGRYEDAVLDLQAASAIWPLFPEARLLLGKALYKDGDRDRADRALRSLWEGIPEEDAKARNEMALWIVLLYTNMGDEAEATKWAARIGQPDRLALDCGALYYSSRYEECMESSRRVLEDRPEDLGALLALGWSDLGCQWSLSGPVWDERRRKLLDLALRISAIYPNDPMAQSFLAHVLQVNGREAEALEAAEESLRVQLRLGEAPLAGALTLALVLQMQERPEEAETILRDALRDFPEQWLLLANLAQVLAAIKDPEKYEEAVGIYETLMKGGGGSAHTYSGLAGLLNELGRHSEAEVAARTALDRLPKNTPAYGHLALAIWKQGRAEEALAAAEEGIRMFPDMPVIRVARSQILQGEGRLPEALEDLSEALKLEPGSAQAHEALRALLERPDRSARIPGLDRILGILEEGLPRVRDWRSAAKRVAETIAELREVLDAPGGAAREAGEGRP